MSLLLSGLTILMIGDSHMSLPHHLQEGLYGELKAAGAKVAAFGVCGSKPTDWLRKVAFSGGCAAERLPGQDVRYIPADKVVTTPMSELLAAYKPNLVVIELADTISGYDLPELPKPWIVDQVQSLTYELSQANVACVWLGPGWGAEGGPYHKTFSGVRRLDAFLAGIVTPCDYVSSLGFSQPGEWKTVDGVHYDAEHYALWAKRLTQAIEQAPSVQALAPH